MLSPKKFSILTALHTKFSWLVQRDHVSDVVPPFGLDGRKERQATREKTTKTR
jgi:hypothetical protein